MQAVVKTLGIHGIKSNLEKFEIPRMMSLAPEVRIFTNTKKYDKRYLLLRWRLSVWQRDFSRFSQKPISGMDP